MTQEGRGLSRNGALLLGVMLAEAEPDGTYSAPRNAACRSLGWSDATLGRVLKELRQRNEISVVTPGGGAGRATRYLVTRLARERVERVEREGVSANTSSFPDGAPSFAAGEQPTHTEHVLEGVQFPSSPLHVPPPDFSALGRGVVDFTAGLAQRAYQHWAGLSALGRATALAPVTCGACWALFRRALGEERAYLGLLAGAALAVLGAFAAPEPVSVRGSLPSAPMPPATERTG